MTRSQVFVLFAGWRLSPTVAIVYAISSFLGALIALDPSGTRTLPVFLIAGAITIVAIVVLVPLARIVERQLSVSIARGVVWFVCVAILIGLIRVLAMLVLASWLNVEPDTPAVSLMFSSALSAIVWLALGGLLVSSRDVFRERYRSLLRQVPDDWDLDPHMQQMKAALAGALAIADSDDSSGSLTRASLTIRQEIEMNLRPLSRRLWFGAGDEEPHIRWAKIFQDALADFRVPVITVTSLWFVGAVVGGIALLGQDRGAVAAFISTAILLSCLLVGRLAVSRMPNVIWGTFVMVASSIIPILGTDAIMRALGYPTALLWENGLMLLLPFSLFAILLSSAAVALAAADRLAVLAVAEDVVISAKRASTFVHNALQSELTGMAMQLEYAARSEDSELSARALERMQALLNRSIAEDFVAFNEDPHRRAGKIADAWRGICDVNLELCAGAEESSRIGLAIEVAEELLSNAVRHSGATEARLSIAPQSTAPRPGALIITCEANTPGDAMGTSGVGSHLLAAASNRPVDVEFFGESTQYRAYVD